MTVRLQNAGPTGRISHVVNHYHAGGRSARISTFSTAPAPKEERDGKCIAVKKDGDPCSAYHTEGSDFCAGHLRAMAKAAAADEAETDQ
jgi:hypothetical protein